MSFSNTTPAQPAKRFTAIIVDLIFYALLSGVLSTIFWIFGMAWLGSSVASLYLLFRDSLPFLGKQSVGKKVAGIKVLNEAGYEIDHATDAKRNFVFIPSFLNSFGIAFLYVGGAFILVLLLIEIYLILNNSGHRRMGDKFAGTVVVDKL